MNWLQITSIIIGSSVLSALLNIWYASYKTRKEEEKKRYEKLYGPLKFNLLMMRLIVINKKEVLDDIKKWLNVEVQINLIEKHVSPLTKKWIKHRDNIKNLFEENPGLIKKDDFSSVSDFMDGCIKREIIEEGKNVLATDENRTNKILKVIEDFQNKLL